MPAASRACSMPIAVPMERFLYPNSSAFLKMVADALAEYRLALQLKPDSALAHFQLGNDYHKNGAAGGGDRGVSGVD